MDYKKTAGAAWKKSYQKNGETKHYLSFKIGEQYYVMFPNNNKKSDKHPDYNIYDSESKTKPEHKQVDSNDDLPF